MLGLPNAIERADIPVREIIGSLTRLVFKLKDL